MSRITIEGSVTPSTFLARGERTTVERSEFIDKLIRKGYVVVVPERMPVAEEIEKLAAPKVAAAKAEKSVRKPRASKNPEPVVINEAAADEDEPMLPLDEADES